MGGVEAGEIGGAASLSQTGEMFQLVPHEVERRANRAVFG